MNPPLSPDLAAYVQDQLATGPYGSEAELIEHAIQLHRDLSGCHRQLKHGIAKGMTSLDAGEGKPLDMNDIKDEVERRYNASAA